MKRLLLATATVLCLTLLAPGPGAQAKWWIFGASDEEIAINYLYLNRVSYDEMGPKVTLYRELLADGLIVLTGKASVAKGSIGSVRISIDGKETWQEAKLSEGGAFEWSFRPEKGKTYKLYVEIMDTSGKTNKVEDTLREVSVSESSIQPTIREALDKLIEAYRAEDGTRFMALVAEDFAGDKVNLDRAIRKDFNAFDNIDLRYTLNNVSTDSKGKIFVSLNFSRQLTSTKSGATLKDAGATEFVFSMGEKSPLVFSMKYPLIFGLSEPGDVATGDVVQPGNNNIIFVDSRGNVQSLTYQEAKQAKDNGGSTIQSKPATINFFKGFNFADGVETNPFEGDITIEGGMIIVGSGVTFNILAATGVDILTEVPERASYISFPQNFALTEGQTVALYLTAGKYVVFEVRTVTGTTASIRYKYQPSGTRFF